LDEYNDLDEEFDPRVARKRVSNSQAAR